VIEALGHKDSVVRRNAAITLGMMGPEAKDAIPALIVALKDRESHVPPSVAAAIWQIDQTAYDVKPILIAALKDADSDTRRTVAEALAHKAPEAPEVNPDLRLALIEALKDEDVRINSAIALSHIKPPAEEAIPILIANYQSAGSYSEVGEALARIGQVAENEVTSALIIAMTTGRKNNPDYQYEAQADALVKIGGAKKAMPVLISALADQDPSIRSRAARVLGRLGPQAKAAVPALKKALNDPDHEVADEAAFALLEIKSRIKF
jgi:HEAT repeat protein